MLKFRWRKERITREEFEMSHKLVLLNLRDIMKRLDAIEDRLSVIDKEDEDIYDVLDVDNYNPPPSDFFEPFNTDDDWFDEEDLMEIDDTLNEPSVSEVQKELEELKKEVVAYMDEIVKVYNECEDMSYPEVKKVFFLSQKLRAKVV